MKKNQVSIIKRAGTWKKFKKSWQMNLFHVIYRCSNKQALFMKKNQVAVVMIHRSDTNGSYLWCDYNGWVYFYVCEFCERLKPLWHFIEEHGVQTEPTGQGLRVFFYWVETVQIAAGVRQSEQKSKKVKRKHRKPLTFSDVKSILNTWAKTQ